MTRLGCELRRDDLYGLAGVVGEAHLHLHIRRSDIGRARLALCEHHPVMPLSLDTRRIIGEILIEFVGVSDRDHRIGQSRHHRGVGHRTRRHMHIGRALIERTFETLALGVAIESGHCVVADGKGRLTVERLDAGPCLRERAVGFRKRNRELVGRRNERTD